MRARSLAAALALAAAPGCLASTVVPPAERAPSAEHRQWRPAEVADLLGYFELLAIEGEAAASLRKVYYHFSDDGTYTGAALVAGLDSPPRFQTLSGTWLLTAGELVLDLDAPVQALASEGLLELRSQGGALVLRHSTL
jgi:hypothetical protein